MNYVYKVTCYQQFENDGLKSTFEIADCAMDVFFVWLSELEKKSKVTYRVKSFTKSPSSKIIFNVSIQQLINIYFLHT